MTTSKIKTVKKSLNEYSKSIPEQLVFWEVDDLSEKERYSNTVGIYDQMPKHFIGNIEREKGKKVDSLPILNRSFVLNKSSYIVSITPASLYCKKTDRTIHYYPSQREELVEDAIRKLAVSKKRSFFLDEDSAVRFTLYELQKELQKAGHGYNSNEIKEAIDICSKCNISIKDKTGNEIELSSAIFPFVAKESSDKIKDGENKYVVMFHPLVTRSIKDGTYRLVNYEKYMSFKMMLSRWLYKKISHNFTGATVTNPYTIRMSTIIRDSVMKEYERKSDNLKQIKKCFAEMKKHGTLSDFKIILEGEGEKIILEGEGKKIIDAKCMLYLSDEFVKDIIKANAKVNLQLKTIINKDLLDEIRSELESGIYGLSKSVIDGIISRINDEDDGLTLKNSIEAAKEAIEKKPEYSITERAKLTRASIREEWKPNYVNNSTAIHKIEEVKYIKEEEDKEEIIKKHTAKQKDPIFLKIKKELESKLDKKDFEKWFKNLELSDISDNKIILLAGSKFIRDWIIKEFIELKSENNIKNIIKSIYPKITRVSVITKEY